jgi:hypothetical protein
MWDFSRAENICGTCYDLGWGPWLACAVYVSMPLEVRLGGRAAERTSVTFPSGLLGDLRHILKGLVLHKIFGVFLVITPMLYTNYLPLNCAYCVNYCVYERGTDFQLWLINYSVWLTNRRFYLGKNEPAAISPSMWVWACSMNRFTDHGRHSSQYCVFLILCQTHP